MIATALAQLNALADPQNAVAAQAYHTTERPYLGLKVPQIEELTTVWRADLSLEDRIQLASDLWDTNIHEARIAASKLLTQARIKPDEAAWDLICHWVPQFDAWAIADHACDAGGRRLVADPSRLDQVEAWVISDQMWSRRAALVITLPWTKMNFPKPIDLVIRDRVLGWCTALAPDKDWFIQKAVAWWLRDLSKHDAARTRAWLDLHGNTLKPWAHKEAAKHLSLG